MRRRVREAAASGKRLDLKNHWVPLNMVSPVAVQAVICNVDPQFFLHRGIDWSRIARAWDYNRRRGGRFMGGSSITMQTVKNVFLWTRKSYLRKALEVPFSYWMELILGKHRILEIYLNVAEWGDGIFGIEAAARHYYGVSAAELDFDQAISLSSVLPNPRIWSPIKPSVFIRVRREILRRRVLRAGAAA
jgi:monofunctional glycosyltransferase